MSRDFDVSNIPRSEMEAQVNALRMAIWDYLVEVDSPIPDVLQRKRLRDHMRRLVGR